jgi:hypothetical protein
MSPLSVQNSSSRVAVRSRLHARYRVISSVRPGSPGLPQWTRTGTRAGTTLAVRPGRGVLCLGRPDLIGLSNASGPTIRWRDFAHIDEGSNKLWLNQLSEKGPVARP